MKLGHYIASCILCGVLLSCSEKIKFTGDPVELHGKVMDQKDKVAALEMDGRFYSVYLDDMATRLITQAKGYQKDSTEWVPVYIKAKKAPRPEGMKTWDTIIKITDILAVMHPERPMDSRNEYLNRLNKKPIEIKEGNKVKPKPSN